MSLGASIIAAAALATAANSPPPASAVTSYAPTYFTASSPTTALDMVQLLPGFTFDNGSSVRGFGGVAGNVLINAERPASKDDGLNNTLKRIRASSVLRIDVIRGGAPGIDMQGKAIIANVVLRSDGGGKLLIATSMIAAADGRVTPAARAEGSLRLGKTSVEGSLLLVKGFDDGQGSGPRIRRSANGTITIRGVETSAAAYAGEKLTGAVETPVAGGKLRVSGSLSLSPYHSRTTDDLTAPPGREFERYGQGQDTAELGVRYARPLGPKLASEIFFLQQLGRSTATDAASAEPSVSAITGDDASDLFGLHKTTGESIVRTKLRYESSKALSIEVGGEGDYNFLTARTSFVQNGLPLVLPAANVHVTEVRGEGFATVVWTATPKLTLEGGLRVEGSKIASTGDVVSSQTFIYPKPRAALTWSPDAAQQVRVRVKREVGQLKFDDFVANSGNISTGAVRAGNPQLNPQTDLVFEGAYERRFWSGGDATVTLRHYALQNVIDRAPVISTSGEFDAPGNIGSGRKDEVACSLTLPTDRLGLKRGLLTGSTTFRSSRVVDPTTLLPRGISDLHPNDWEAHFTQGLPLWKATWGFDAFGQWQSRSYRFNEIDTDKLKTYVEFFDE